MAVSRKKILSRVFFLGVTTVALITECWFAWDGDPETDPWTDLIGDYVPWQAALAVFGALLLWVPAHFVVRYRREAAEQAVKKQAARDSLARVQRELDRVNALLRQEGISPEITVDENGTPDQGTLF